ncbi:MAG: arginine repressor [Bdellovibrionaceae bacterium]|nr:arginine repressor [Pseudobdellovibrionaceae bacterium]
MDTINPRNRLKTLKDLLSKGELSTQEELVKELRDKNFDVTQSTISRDLRKLGAMKAIDSQGRTIYKLSEEAPNLPLPQSGFRHLIVDIQENGSMIVIHTSPGSASLVARQLDLDSMKRQGIMGTIAGDDTVFVAPTSPRKIKHVVQLIHAEFA